VHPDSFIIGAQEEAGMPPVEEVHAPAGSAKTVAWRICGPGKIFGELQSGKVRA
jgi:hypothetical protein